ncbi:MAG: hypothetical protein AAGK14_15115 [Verrucomicrobiota bacterium]
MNSGGNGLIGSVGSLALIFVGGILLLFLLWVFVYFLVHALTRTDLPLFQRLLWVALILFSFPLGCICYHFLSNPSYPKRGRARSRFS